MLGPCGPLDARSFMYVYAGQTPRPRCSTSTLPLKPAFHQLCFGERMQLQKLIYVAAGKDIDKDYKRQTSVPQMFGFDLMSAETASLDFTKHASF